MYSKPSPVLKKSSPFSRLSKNIPADSSFSVAENKDGSVYLTPYLSLIVAILYMMSADDEITEQECNHLLSVYGGDNQVLHRALQYVDHHSVEDFFAEVADAVDEENRLCILLNVCDSSMSDGDFDQSEMILFSRMLGIFGQNKNSFKPYFETISIKNKHSVLKKFEKSADNSLTPPLALAASMLYMMSVDGDIAAEEIGQINVAIRDFKDILPIALKYVKQIKFHEFIKLANAILTHPQKLCVLVNVCDCMLADGRVDRLEQDLFKRMLAGFEITAQNFNKHFQNLAFKNEKPSDIRKASKSDVSGEVIINTFNTEDSRQFADAANDNIATNVKAPIKINVKNPHSAEINKKISANIEKSALQNQLESEVDVIAINAQDLEKEEESKKKKSTGKLTSPKVDKKNDNAETDLKASNQRANKEASDHNKNKIKNSTEEGPIDQRLMRDAKGDADLRSYKSTEGPSYQRHMHDADGVEPQVIEREAALETSPSALHHHPSKNTENQLHARMDYLKIWTNKLKNNLDKFETINIHHSITRSTGLNLIALKPECPPALLTSRAASRAARDLNTREMSQHTISGNIQMNENSVPTENESVNTAIQSRSRLKLAAITTGLIITQGFSNYGMNEAQSNLLMNQAVLSTTHIAVKAATIEQTALNLTADVMDNLSIKNDADSVESIDPNKTNAETYRSKVRKIETAPQTNDGKKELNEKIALLEDFNATQLMKMKWFGLSNSILMLGFFIAFFGLLFRSRLSVIGSSLMLTLGLVVTVNGYFLLV